MSTEIRGVLFDKDGTLFDYATTWEAWTKSLLFRMTQGDNALASRAAEAIGFDFKAGKFASDSLVIAGTPGDIADVLIGFFPTYTKASLIEVLNSEAAAAPQAEAAPLRPLLEHLRAADLRLGVATNDAEAPARVHLESAGVIDMFDFIAGFDSGFGGKPEPGQLLGFAQAVGLDPSQVVMVGDSLHDLHAGRAAGMACVGVLTGMAQEPELAPFADVVMPDIAGLPRWLGLPDIDG